MSAKNKFSTKIFIAKTELEATMNTRLDEFKNEIKADKTSEFNSLNMKLPTLNSNKPYYYYE